jgi:endogenous inhibitor of DNA gyrase (YacG/DUF329 family)
MKKENITYKCPHCGATYLSPVPVECIAHKCPKCKGKPVFFEEEKGE